jgi:transcription termination/antitermination protein NusG
VFVQNFCQEIPGPDAPSAQHLSVAALPWYVIHARSRQEARVALALRQKGLEIFLPRITVCSRRQDRRLFLQLPLFPGYLFVRTVLELQAYYEIIKHPGVVRLLGINGCPGIVPPEQVDSIQAIVASDRTSYPWAYLGQGRQVRIMAGPLSGIVGTILRRRGNKPRLVVAVELFQRSVAVELENEAVEPYS